MPGLVGRFESFWPEIVYHDVFVEAVAAVGVSMELGLLVMVRVKGLEMFFRPHHWSSTA